MRLFLSGLSFWAGYKYFSKIAAAFALPQASTGRIKKKLKGNHDLVIAKGEDPYLVTVKAIEAMGGIKKFVKPKSVVLIKPNIAWDRTPEQAATTNPQVVAALIDLCFQAQAKRVNVFDNSCNEARRCYLNSGIQKIAKEHGANVYFADSWDVVKANFSYESPMQDWPIFRDALECDTFINVPILKHHRLTELTLSMKNLMGICSGNRSKIHTDIARKLVDITDFISPELNVIDAYRVLICHGPVGGNLEDVLKMNTVIVGTDPTLTDACASRLVGKEPLSIPCIKNAVERKLGSIDLENANIFHMEVRE